MKLLFPALQRIGLARGLSVIFFIGVNHAFALPHNSIYRCAPQTHPEFAYTVTINRDSRLMGVTLWNGNSGEGTATASTWRERNQTTYILSPLWVPGSTTAEGMIESAIEEFTITIKNDETAFVRPDFPCVKQ